MASSIVSVTIPKAPFMAQKTVDASRTKKKVPEKSWEIIKPLGFIRKQKSALVAFLLSFMLRVEI